MEESKLNQYLNKLKLEEKDAEKVWEMYQISQNLAGEEILDIFITDYLVGEEREYKNLFFFSSHFIVECKKFLQSDEFNLYWLPNLLSRVTHSVKSYDFKEVNNKARFHIEILTSAKDSIEMKATGNNCSSLFEIYKKYILPNFKS